MKNSILIFIVKLIFINYAFSQAPTYNLTAKNFTLGSINYPNDALYFDVYLEWTNPGVAPNFELSGTQLYFSFNHNVLTGTWPPGGSSANIDTSEYSYKIVGSDLPSNMQPRKPSLWTASSPTADVMRCAINTFPGAGFGVNIPAGFPGIKIVRYRLWNKAGAFNNVPLNIAWRNPPIVAFATKIFAYVGTTNTDITTPSTHYLFYDNSCSIICNASVSLLNPLNNAVNININPTFVWSKFNGTTNYILQVSNDSGFTSVVYIDSAITDTFKTVTGLNANTTYFWKVGRKDSLLNYYYTLPWKFTTRSVVALNLKYIQEGMYSSLFNLTYRKDTLKLYLRNASPPYNLVDSASDKLDSVNFNSGFTFANAPSGNYYIVAKHFNTLETWSKAGGQYLSLDSISNYDFTTSASQAYGNNLKLKGSKYCAYTGDVDQNGFIDGEDMSRIDNDAYLYLSGNYLPSDLNGDGTVDGADFLMGDNNWQYITIKSPLNTDNSNFKHRIRKYFEP